MPFASNTDRWHSLLTSRYVCEFCLTRFFLHYRKCPACRRLNTIHPLLNTLFTVARNNGELRRMMSRKPGLKSKSPPTTPPAAPGTDYEI
jgi:hypothetical protein